jgi:hypothetical protein
MGIGTLKSHFDAVILVFQHTEALLEVACDGFESVIKEVSRLRSVKRRGNLNADGLSVGLRHGPGNTANSAKGTLGDAPMPLFIPGCRPRRPDHKARRGKRQPLLAG